MLKCCSMMNTMESNRLERHSALVARMNVDLAPRFASQGSISELIAGKLTFWSSRAKNVGFMIKSVIAKRLHRVGLTVGHSGRLISSILLEVI